MYVCVCQGCQADPRGCAQMQELQTGLRPALGGEGQAREQVVGRPTVGTALCDGAMQPALRLPAPAMTSFKGD